MPGRPDSALDSASEARHLASGCTGQTRGGAGKKSDARVHPTARLDGCRAAGTTAVKLLPPYRSAGDARARLPGQSLAWPRLPAHPCVHVARKHGPARWRCPPLRHCAHVDTTVGDHSSVCVLCCPCLLAVKLARRIPTAREGSHARGAPAAAPGGARALSASAQSSGQVRVRRAERASVARSD